MVRTPYLLLLLSPLLLASCSTLKKSVLVGIGSGAATGAIIGSATRPHDRGHGAGVGALIGAAVGTLSSVLIHKGLEKRDDKTRQNTLFNLEKYDVLTPNRANFGAKHAVTLPKIDSEWVETTVKGRKLIEGHRVWFISDDPQWVPAEEVKK